MLQTYQSSERVPSKFFIEAPLALAGAAILGAVYQVIMHYLPLIYLDAIICVGMGIATGYAVRLLIKSTHCRNKLAGAGLGLAAALVAVAVGHYVEYRFNRPGMLAGAPPDILAILEAKLTFWQYIEIRADAGWSIGKAGSTNANSPTISGAMSYVIWGIEAIIIAAGAIYGSFTATREPYCDSCNKWADHKMVNLSVPASSALVQQISAATSVDALLPAPDAPDVATPNTILYTITSCPACKTFHTLKVDHQTIVANGKNIETKSNTLRERILLSSTDVARFVPAIAPPTSPAADADTPPASA
jgi:hypothetical protein